jgi:hypothetical protein
MEPDSWSGSTIPIGVEDDGHHADGAADDGISVGAFVAGKTYLYMVRAEGRTISGARYTAENRVEVEEKGDLLLADTIAVSSDPRVGKPVALTVTVRNEGTLDFHGVTLDLDLGPGETTLEEREARRTFDLRAGESRRVSTEWTPTEPRDYEVRLMIEPYLEPSSSDFANNTRKTVVRVR